MLFSFGRSSPHRPTARALFITMSLTRPKVFSFTVKPDSSGMSATHACTSHSPVTVSTKSLLNTFDPNSTVASASHSASHHRPTRPLDSCSASTLLNRLSVKVRLVHGWSAPHAPSPHPLFSTSVLAPVFAACTLPMSVSSGVSTPHAPSALALSSTNHPSLDHGRFISSVASFGRSTLTRLHHAHCAASGCRTSAARRRASPAAPGPAGLRLTPPPRTHPPAPAPPSSRPRAPRTSAPPASARLRLTPPLLAHFASPADSASPPTRRPPSRSPDWAGLRLTPATRPHR